MTLEIINSYRLRPIREEDLPMLLAWRNSERVHSEMLTDHKITWEEHVAWFQRHAADNPSRTLIFELDGRPLGYVGYTEFDEEHHTCSPGDYLGETENVPIDAGLKLECMSLEYAFEILGMEYVETSVFADNGKVAKLDEFLGYRRLEEDLFYEKHGIKKRAYRYAMTKLDWQNSRWSHKSRPSKRKIRSAQ